MDWREYIQGRETATGLEQRWSSDLYHALHSRMGERQMRFRVIGGSKRINVALMGFDQYREWVKRTAR